ncbi:hypothetical protein GCM10022294_06200 [Dietzia aurantiaca]
MTPAAARAEVARPTVATDSPVVAAISGRETGPRNRIARMTRAELMSERRRAATGDCVGMAVTVAQIIDRSVWCS